MVTSLPGDEYCKNEAAQPACTHILVDLDRKFKLGHALRGESSGTKFRNLKSLKGLPDQNPRSRFMHSYRLSLSGQIRERQQ